MAEWSNAAVLKTVEGHTSGGSNPSSSAIKLNPLIFSGFFVDKLSSFSQDEVSAEWSVSVESTTATLSINNYNLLSLLEY